MSLFTTMRLVALSCALVAFQSTAEELDGANEKGGAQQPSKRGGEGEKGGQGGQRRMMSGEKGAMRGPGQQIGPQGVMQQKGGEMGAPPPEQMLNMIKAEDPEKYNELVGIKDANPEKFRDMLKAYLNEKKEKIQAEFKAVKELADKYRSTKDDKVKAELKAKLKQQLQNRLDMQEKQLKAQEENIKKGREALDKKKANMDQLVEDRIKELTQDPDLKW